MLKRPLALLVTVVLYASSSQAATITFNAILDGPSESPPVDTPGTGVAQVIYDDVAHTLAVSATFQDLIGPTTAAHIHCCTLPTAGVATQAPSFVGFPLGVTAGSFSNTYDLTLASSWNASFITANSGTLAGAEAALAGGLLAGVAYFNIHTTFRPGGEIRGFLQPQQVQVPEPATLSLLGVGVGLAAARRRRQNRSKN